MSAESYALTCYTSTEEFDERSATRAVEVGTKTEALLEIGKFIRDYSSFVAMNPDHRRLLVTLDRIPCPTCGK